MEKVNYSVQRTLLLIAGIVIALLAVAMQTMAQGSDFLYGKVYTTSATYEGQIRWGDEEAFWTDFFNASKKSSGYKKIAEKKDDESWVNFDWDLLSIWENKTTLHQFSCQFGDIQELQVLTGSNVRLRFKNGIQIEVNGEGYNDIGTKIRILDKELGWTALNWEKVKKVEFSSIPKGTPVLAMAPLYGTVETSRREKFTGYIQWDHDERVSTDKLDGDSDDGKISAAFSTIASIEKKGNGCDVTYRSGRKLYLTGSNDVDNSNRGVIVIMPGKGMVDIPWRAFRNITFTDAPQQGIPYESFAAPKPLSGKVLSYDEKELSGTIVYDLDETLDVETLEGKDNEIEYTIPFRNIKSIRPKNSDYSLVELKTGETLLLGDGRDVSGTNDGLLIMIKGKKEPRHIRWNMIEQIIFE